jgi:hypothetical protein
MEPHEVHASHPPHTGHRWFDFAMAGSALLVSAISLYVAVHHGQTMEKLVEANSFPNIEVGASVSDGARPGTMDLKIAFENTGVGPARVETVEFWDGAKPIVSADQILQAIKAGGDGRPLDARLGGDTVVGSLVGLGKTRDLVSLEMDSATWEGPTVRFMERFRSRVCYCSVFEECYVTDSNTDRGRPRYVKKCPSVSAQYQDDISGILGRSVAPKS